MFSFRDTSIYSPACFSLAHLQLPHCYSPLIMQPSDDDGSSLYGTMHAGDGRAVRRPSPLMIGVETPKTSKPLLGHQGEGDDTGGTVEGTATIPNEIFNMVKNLVGAGALGLPSGVAAYANAPSALGPASFITLSMGAIFAYYFLLMGRICKMTYTTTYREAWDVTVGQKGSSLIALTTVLMAGLGNLAYSMILADTSRSLIMATGVDISRTGSLIFVTVFALLPLCLAKNLAVLAPFSLVGMGAMVFTLVVMGIRCFDGTYDPSKGGKFIEDLSEEFKPNFGELGASGAMSLNSLLLVCMTFQAFFAHYNAPRYYMELEDNTVQRFSVVVGSSFGIAAVFYIVMTVFGFVTFGSYSNGFILNNYSTNDSLASMSRAAIFVAILFTFPLPFIGVRDGILDILMVPPEKQTPAFINILTIAILTTFTVMALHFDDLGMVNAVGGGSLGTLVVFVFPAFMYRGYVRNLGSEASRSQKREASFAIGLMCIGIMMGSVGVWVALSAPKFGVES